MSTKEHKVKAQQDYPGASTNKADDNRTTRQAVKQETKMMNNNPRNSDMKMP
ncbi:MAG: hypothetical protein NC405_04360 [Odoribacter sp.]|nr:hypothetical protein [Odoribacter sp.]